MMAAPNPRPEMHALVKQAAALDASGAIAEAVDAWSRMVELDPSFELARMGLAQALIRANRPSDALEHLETALSSLPKHPAA